jgi:hypothetical protein
LLLRLVVLPSEMRLWKKRQRVLTVYGLILDAAVLSYCSRIAPNISESQLTVAEELS